jgi:energy-coupling factor transport system permease protein
METKAIGTIHPVARGLAAAVAVAGTLLGTSVLGAAVAWVAVLIPLTALAGVLRQHLRFVLTILTPISLALFVIWGWIVGAPPGAPVGSAPAAGAGFAALVALRLALLGGIGQLCFSTIPSDRLVSTLRSWGIKGEGLVIAVSSLTLVPEMQLRAEQVLTARYARGFVRNRNLFSKLQQVPHLLRPLMAWVLRSAIQRAEGWEQRRLLVRMGDGVIYTGDSSLARSSFYLLMATAWLVCGIATRALQG